LICGLLLTATNAFAAGETAEVNRAPEFDEFPSSPDGWGARTRLETLWIFEADFEDLTGDNAGWTSFDNSGIPPAENFWHHDTIRINGFGHLGDSTWWCGTNNICWVQPRGYGNNWYQILQRSFPEIVANTSVEDPLTLEWDQRYAMEHDYDYGYVDISTDGGQNWETRHTVNNSGFVGQQGTPADWDDPTHGHITLDLSEFAGQILDLRFRFESDIALSPQDTPDNPSHSVLDGAWQLDNITWSGPGGAFWSDDSELYDMGWVHDDFTGTDQTGVSFWRGRFGVDFFTGRDFSCEDRPVGSWMYSTTSQIEGTMVDWENTWLISPPIDISGVTSLVARWDYWIDMTHQSNDVFNLLVSSSDNYDCVVDPGAFEDESPGWWFGGPSWSTNNDNWEAFAGNDWLATMWHVKNHEPPEPGQEHMAGFLLNWQKIGAAVGDPGTDWSIDGWYKFNDWFRDDIPEALTDTARIRVSDQHDITSVYLLASDDAGQTWESYECLQEPASSWWRAPPPANQIAEGAEIRYYFEATDGLANVSVYPAGAPDDYGEMSILPITGSTSNRSTLLVDKYRRLVPGENRQFEHQALYYYEDALKKLGFEYDVYEVEVPFGSANSLGPDTSGMKYYDTQIWFFNWGYAYGMRNPDQWHITEWLSEASVSDERNFLLSSNNVGWGFYVAGLPETLDFFNTWLATNYIYGAQGDIMVDSLCSLIDYEPGSHDFITDGGSKLMGGCPVLGYYDVLQPTLVSIPDGEAVAEYERLDLTTASAGVAYTDPATTYQTVNLGFAIEDMAGPLQPNGYFIDGGPHRRNLLRNIMEYFGKTPTLARTFLVRPDGTGDYATIQDAINAAAGGDTIDLAAGTFTGAGNVDLDYLGMDITVRSEDDDPTLCIIDCEDNARGVHFNNEEGPTSVLRGVTIARGYAETAGGGILCNVGSAPTIDNCVFDTCSSGDGAGLACVNANPHVVDCVFEGNSVQGLGGAVYLESSPTSAFDRCTFTGNYATQGGGVALNTNCNPILTDCLFSENGAMVNGGAAMISLVCFPQFTNCTFSGNSASGSSGLFVADSSVALIDHSIIAFGILGQAIQCSGGGSASLTCTDVYGNEGGDYVGCIAGQNGVSGNISADPIFCDRRSGDYRLRDTSPCLDVVGCELVGALGVGCWAAHVWHVPSEVPTITAAMGSAAYGDTIIVACDTYYESDIQVTSGVTLMSETGDPDCVTIHGGRAGTVLEFVDVDVTTVVIGITIKGGTDAGAFLDASAPHFVACVFDSNQAGVYAYGGGVHCENGSGPSFENCVFSANSTGAMGGGLYCKHSDVSLTECLFVGNDATDGGGAWADSSSTLTIVSCTLTGNGTMQGPGSGIGLDSSSTADISHTIVAFNLGGEGIYCSGGVSLSCSNVYGNDGGDYEACIAGMNGVDGNISADPIFCGPESYEGPYYVRTDSPCAEHNNTPGCGLIGAYGLSCVSYVDWDGGGDGSSWGDSLNWDPDQVPGPNDHARITLEGDYTVFVTEETLVWALTHGGGAGRAVQTLDIESGNFAVLHGATNRSEIIVRDPASFEAREVIDPSVISNEVGASFRLDDGDLLGTGSFDNSGLVTKTGIGTSYVPLTFLNEGQTRGGGLVTVDAGSLSVDGDFDNAGRVTVNTGGTAIVSSHFFGRETRAGTVQNSGSVDVDGTLAVDGTFENTGRVTVNTGGTAIVSSHFFDTDRETRGGFTNAVSGTVAVDGSIEVDGDMSNAGRVTVNTGGTAIVSSHFIEGRQPRGGFDSTGTISIAAGASITATGTGSVTTSGTFEASGTVFIESGGDFLNTGAAEVGIGGDFYADGSVINDTDANFVNRGQVIVGGTLNNDGFFDHQENAVLAGSGVYDTADGLSSMKGIVSPGASHGELTFVGNFVQSPTSQLHLEVGGYVAGSEYDRLTVFGTSDLAGVVSISFDPEFVPVVGDSFDVIVHEGMMFRDTTDFGCFSGLDIGDTLHIEPIQRPEKFQLLTVGGTTGNQSPLAADDADSVLGYQPIMIPVLDNDDDPDFDALRIIEVLTDATDGLAWVEQGDLGVTYAASYGFEGIDEFDYVITDCAGGVDTARVTIGVTAPPMVLNVPDDYGSIQAALTAASPGDTILIACGTYEEGNVTVPSGVILASATGDPDCVIIDASGRAARGLICTGLDSTTVVLGITVTGASTSGYGGGMYCEASSHKVIDCRFTGNYGQSGGGIACVDASSPTFIGCEITGNTGAIGAGMICYNNSSPTIERCLFIDNVSSSGGGGLATIVNSSPDVVRCTFSENSAPQGGGIYSGDGAAPTVDHTIIAFSVTAEAAYCYSGGTVALSCSDVYGNAGGDYVGCLSGQNGENGNFSAEPLFCDMIDSDYHLAVDSPCAAPPGCGVVGALPVGCIGDTEIDVSPASLEMLVAPDDPLACEPLTLRNDGRTSLMWLVREEEAGARLSARTRVDREGVSAARAVARAQDPTRGTEEERPKGERDSRVGRAPLRDSGGPDAFGYSWIDSDEPGGPTFDWFDITSSGTEVALGDDDSEEVALPFDFPFYGVAHDAVTISSNGYLTFGPVGVDYSNDPVPHPSGPDDLIAAFWTDLDPSAGGTVHYLYDAVDDRFVVQYTGINDFWASGPKTFQIALYPNGTILIQYLTIEGYIGYSTVGIENADASIGLEVVFNGTYVHGSLALLIEDTAPFMTENPPGGVLPGLGTEIIDVCVDVSGLPEGVYDYVLVVESNDIDEPEVTVPITVTVAYPPSAVVAPESVSGAGEIGEIYTDPLILRNDGGLDLVWMLGKDELTPKRAREGAARTTETPAGGRAGVRGSGGPDAHGYVWTDSDEPGGPTYAWREIIQHGGFISLGDDDAVTVDLPFDFGFYGGTVFADSVTISSNGYLTFDTEGADGENTPIPSGAGPNAIIAPFWDDLDPGSGGIVLQYYDAADTSFIVEFIQVPRAGGGGTYTFQVILQKDWESLTGDIIFQYNDMQGELGSATIGIENANATTGLEIAFDTTYVHNGLAVAIEELYGWVDADPRAGVVAAGDSTAVDVITDCRRAPEGTYEFNLMLYSNDPLDPAMSIPYYFAVLATEIADETLPTEFALKGNFPNPFNPATVIRYDLPVAAEVGLRIYDVSGRLVRVLLDDTVQEPGRRSVAWDGRDNGGKHVASGVYFYELEANGEERRRKMILLK